MIQAQIRGDKQALRNLEELPTRMRRLAITRSMRVAGKPMLAAARRNAPNLSGRLAKAIKLKMWKRSRSKDAKRNPRVGISVQVGKDGWYKGKTFYAAFQEFGWHRGKRTSAIRRKHSADARKLIEGKHFIERTYDTMGAGAMRTFFAVMPSEVAKLKFKLEQQSGGTA